MRTTRRWLALALVAGWFGAAVLMASPASADVNCSDLGSQAAAQTYFDGRTGDLDHLDGDGDGQACEANAPHTGGTWTLILLGVLFAAGLARYTTFTKDTEVQSAEAPAPVEAVSVGAAGAARADGCRRCCPCAAPADRRQGRRHRFGRASWPARCGW